MIDLKVDDGALSTLSGEVRRARSNMTSALDAHQQDMRQMHDEWTGMASASAANWHQQWRTDITAYADFLGRFADVVDRIDTIYQQADQTAGAMWPV